MFFLRMQNYVRALVLVLGVTLSSLQASVKTYVANTDGNISVLDAESNTFIKNFIPQLGNLSAGNLQGIAISPDALTAYVVDNDNLGIWVINTSTDTAEAFVLLETDITASNPNHIQISPTGEAVYIGDSFAGVVWIVQTSNYAVSDVSAGPTKPSDIAFNPSGDKYYVSDTGFAANSAYVFVTATNELSTPSTITGAAANFIAINQQGVGLLPGSGSSIIYVFNTSSDQLTKQIDTSLLYLRGVDFSPDQTTAYVGAQEPPSLAIIENQEMTGAISLTRIPNDVAVNPIYPQKIYYAGEFFVTMVINGVEVINPSFDSNIPSSSYIAYIVPTDPAAPPSLSGSVIKNKFVLQTDIVHRLTWSASPSPNTTSYAIYRNGVQIATVSASNSLSYDDHNRPKNRTDFYQVKTISEQGIQGQSASVSVP